MTWTVDWPEAEYHQILPRLYLGGHTWKKDGVIVDSGHSTVSTDGSWDYVVSAYFDGDWRECIPQCDTRYVLFEDTERGLDEETWKRIRSAVYQITDRWLYEGEKVLVRCQAGYNRSGLIMCLVLMHLGFTADGAINVCRKLRGKDVLINPIFENYVREREAEYRLPDRFAITEMACGEWMETIS